MSKDNIQIRIIQPKDYKAVVQFVYEHFDKDEPLCSCEPKIEPAEDDFNDMLECLESNCSIMAVQVTGQEEEELIGINIAVPKDPSSIETYFETAKKVGLDTKYGQIMQLLGVVSRNADVFKRYGVNKLLYSFLVCVKASARGKNLGTLLKMELMTLGKSLGFKLLTADCTGFYSARILERLKWDRVHFIAYKDYVDENKKQIFTPSAPHVGLNSFAIRL